MAGVKKSLLDLMACPKCKGDIEQKGMFLLCKRCNRAYPVYKEGVPNMLITDAWKLEKAERAGFRHNLSLHSGSK